MTRRALVLGASSISVAAVLRVLLAPLRMLTADEAYYLSAARRGPLPWSIHDHPPLLGVLLRLADRAMPGPVELRVRIVAIVLQIVTALGVARLASRLGAPGDEAERRSGRGASESSDRRWALGAVLATWGLLPMAGGLLATPDAPVLACLAWLLALLTEPSPLPPRGGARDELGRRAALVALAALAVASKASALPFALVLAVAHLAHRGDAKPTHRARGVAIALGALLAAPFAFASLRAQLGHVLGRGALVGAPYVGPLAATGAFVAGQVLLLGPAVVLTSVRRGRVAGSPPPGAWLATGLAFAAALGSALVSGRPPEPNWTAPAAILLFTVTAVGISSATLHVRTLVLGVTIAPALVAVVLWALPVSPLPPRIDPLVRVPRHGADAATWPPPGQQEPAYAQPSRRCVYLTDCGEFDAITR